MSSDNKQAFALPTVLIISIIMLTILASAVASNSAVRVALRDQYYNKLSQQASDAGVTYAKACMAANAGTPQWSDAKPLKPNTDCNGDQIAGFTCDASSTDSRCSVLVVDDNTVVTFTVPAPLPDSTGAFTNISSKGSVSLLRKTDNTVWKQYGYTAKAASVVAPGSSAETHWKQLSTGNFFSCGIASNDQIYCWGYNNAGQLGDNTTTNRSVPAAVYTAGALNGLTIKLVSVGSDYACAIASNDKAYCWGYNANGQLGDNTAVSKSVPTAVYTAGVLSTLTIKSISAGSDNTCVVASNNKAYCWGNNTYGQLGDNTVVAKSVPTAVYTAGVLSALTIQTVSVGNSYACVLASNNLTYCWGYNGYGEIGDNTIVNKSVPTAVNTSGVLSGLTVKSISTGDFHTCVIASNDKAYCWGDNDSGQVGDNTIVNKSVPTAVNTSGVLSGLTVKSISAGGYHTCAVASNSLSYCWGYDYYGEIGDNASTDKSVPTAVSTAGLLSGLTIKSISAGDFHTCAIASNDQAYCWGNNGNGQLADNSIVAKSVPAATDTSGALNGLTIKSVSSGADHTCAIASNDQAYCWGNNTNGQLGDNTTVFKSVPTAVYTGGALSGLTIKSISVGDFHTCAIASNDKMYCWGGNSAGQLGDNTSVDKLVPTAVYTAGALAGLTIKSISINYNNSCAIASNSLAYCWGDNTVGQLGINSLVSKLVPTAVYTKGAVSGLTVKAISVDNYFACYIASNDKAYCWGYNNSGQIGDNTLVNKSIPTAVVTTGVLSGLTISSISAAYNRTCVVASNGKAYCWGLNASGQLGDNTTVNKSVPVAVNATGVLSGLTLTSISNGSYHSCVTATNLLSYCWGLNTSGQLGDDTIVSKSVPVAVNTVGVLSGLTIKSISGGGAHTCAIASNDKLYCWGYNMSGQLGILGRTLTIPTASSVKTTAGMPVVSGPVVKNVVDY